jgi:hypothetical protein
MNVNPSFLEYKELMKAITVNITTTSERMSIRNRTSQCFFPETGARGLRTFVNIGASIV